MPGGRRRNDLPCRVFLSYDECRTIRSNRARQPRVAVNCGFVFEIADAATRQHDSLKLQICGIGRLEHREQDCGLPPSNHCALPTQVCASLEIRCGDFAVELIRKIWSGIAKDSPTA